MKKQSIIFFLLFVVFVASANNKTTQQKINNTTTDTTITYDLLNVIIDSVGLLTFYKINQTNIIEAYDVLTAIHKTIDSVGLLTLPYKIHFNQGAIFIIDDKLIEQLSWGGRRVYGVLPDTTNFYGLIIEMATSLSNPRLVIFDKKGKFVDEKYLLENNCYDLTSDESCFCDEYIQINEDLTLFYYYNAKYLYGAYNEELDEYYGKIVCKHYEKKGNINKKGKIIFEERQEFPVENCENK